MVCLDHPVLVRTGKERPAAGVRGRTEAARDRSPRGDVSAKSPASEPSVLARPLPRNSKMGFKSSRRKTARTFLKQGAGNRASSHL